ncbi:MAG: hypothetical protein LBU38_06430 [Propionibacteriaceae bacterium]|jgi:hypothetical protein|nr:hypothetical protein [Propionibacteriaceae bacterium]
MGEAESRLVPKSLSWFAVLFQALAGKQPLAAEELPSAGNDANQLAGLDETLATLAIELGKAGWPVARIRAHALARLVAGESWPHPVDLSLVRAVGPARYAAALESARRTLGLWTLTELPPSTRTDLNADERRLLADVPTHHGVG